MKILKLLELDGFAKDNLQQYNQYLIDSDLLNENPYSIKHIMQKDRLLPFGIVLTMMCLMEFTGIDVVIFNSADIFHTARK